MRSPLVADPWTVAQIEAAVAPYAGVLSAQQLAWMREQLAETLATDVAASQLLRRAHPRVVDESGQVATEKAPSAEPVRIPGAAAPRGRGRGRAG